MKYYTIACSLIIMLAPACTNESETRESAVPVGEVSVPEPERPDFPSDENVDTGGAVLGLKQFPMDELDRSTCLVGNYSETQKFITLEFENTGTKATSQSHKATVSFCRRTSQATDCMPNSSDVVGTVIVEVPVIQPGETKTVLVDYSYKAGELNPENRVDKCSPPTQDNAVCRISIAWSNQLQHRFCRVVYG